MKQKYPTKEEVDWVKAYIKTWAFRQDRERLEKFCDAYLAQGESLVNERLRRKQEYWEGREVIDRLQAENQALREEVERKDKLIKRQDGFIMDKSAIAAERSTQISQLEVEVKQLKADNEALRARLNILEAR